MRVIAATNRKLSDALKEGSFREDLYYRLNAVRISLPPLRERPEDILLLVHHFTKRFTNNVDVDIDPEALKLLTSYPWLGNVRELENVMERAVLLAKHGKIEVSHLPPELKNPASLKAGLLSLEAMESLHITRVLRVVKDLDEAARFLGIDPATLWRKRKKYGIKD
ncbi:MAG: sigma 54-interacting transcriptional regulator [Ignavibacteriales bacterium]|nr:sigma 54-interacting transcriptional regulator [Ignavibacteriales bacterium]